MYRRSQQRTPANAVALLAALAIGSLVLAACAPGSDQDDEPSKAAASVSTELPTGDVTLTMYAETGFPLFEDLAHEFERQYPNVHIKVRTEEASVLEQNAPRLMAGDDAPDLIRLDLKPDQVADGLVLNLDPYADAYGWDALPDSQLAPLRVNDDHTQLGSGSLYGFGPNASLTGVYYNKDLATSLGMTEPPATLDELESWLVKAKEAGIVPLVQSNNSGAATITFQSLLNQYVKPETIQDFVFNAADASLDTDGAVEAASTLQSWATKGYINDDANAVDYTTMVGRFVAGDALFMFLGNWQAADLANQMGDNVGFFPTPPLQADGQHVAMSAFGGAVIPAKAQNPDVAAFVLNWMAADPQARQLGIDTTGMAPAAFSDAPAPDVDPASVVAEALQAFTQVAADDGLVGFVDTATSGLAQNAITPGLQSLLADRVTPEQFIKDLQSGYEDDLN